MKSRMNKTLKSLSTHIYSNKEFFLEIGKTLGKGAGTIGLLYLASKLNVPLSISPTGSISNRSSWQNSLSDLNINVPNIIFSRNSQDSAIATFAELGRSADFDSTKRDYVNKIFNIAKDCTDDNTRMLAVSSINQIINAMDWESSKRYATDYILRLAKENLNK